MNFFEFFQVSETPVHYCARHGNNEILLALFNAASSDEVQRLVNQKTRVSACRRFRLNGVVENLYKL